MRRHPNTGRTADVIDISNKRYAQQGNRRGYLQVAPELVVEVLGPSDSWGGVMAKLGDYFASGVRMVWAIAPEARQVFVYRSLTNMRQFGEEDTLASDEILPDLALPVANLFVDVSAHPLPFTVHVSLLTPPCPLGARRRYKPSEN